MTKVSRDDIERIRASDLFDAEWYLEQYPDVRALGMDPAEHYLWIGAKLGRDPGPNFDSHFYLGANDDVARANFNPLLHYVICGGREDRTSAPSRKRKSTTALDISFEGRRINRLQQSPALGERDPSYAPLMTQTTNIAAGEPSVLAFYLPQFHPITENNEWWGRGFTEWTNVSKATPQFANHYQPRLPGELGFYDLRVPEVMTRQIELARLYGLSGFCFHYYWFGGHRLLERPVEMFLTNKSEGFNFPFCLCWANENWTRRWDGAEVDVLIAQSHSPEDHARVFADLARYMSDERYIRVDGKPMILVYRPAIIPDALAMSSIWRDLAVKHKFPGIYLVATDAFGFDDPSSIGFDALCQFPPHAVSIGEITASVHELSSSFKGRIYNYEEAVEAWLQTLGHREANGLALDYFPGVMTGWDNEARRPERGHVFHRATPAKFYNWLKGAVDWSRRNHPDNKRFVFVNAWNEWAEGTYLEPDRRFGYAYLSAVSAVRREAQSNRAALSKICYEAVQGRKRNSDTVICLHIFYEDLIDELSEAIAEGQALHKADVIVSIPETWTTESARKLITTMSPVRILISENRGRDVWPFLQALRTGLDMGYEFGCKIHSKKSPHLSSGGGQWRSQLLQELLSPGSVKKAMELLRSNEVVGLAAPDGAYYPITDPAAMRDNWFYFKEILERANAQDAVLHDFVAGTMFWFRFTALSKIAALSYDAVDFGPELGAIDGTLAHAFERAFPTLITSSGFRVGRYRSQSKITPY